MIYDYLVKKMIIVIIHYLLLQPNRMELMYVEGLDGMWRKPSIDSST